MPADKSYSPLNMPVTRGVGYSLCVYVTSGPDGHHIVPEVTTINNTRITEVNYRKFKSIPCPCSLLRTRDINSDFKGKELAEAIKKLLVDDTVEKIAPIRVVINGEYLGVF